MLTGGNEKTIDLLDMYIIESEKNKKNLKNLNINEATHNLQFEEITLHNPKPCSKISSESPQPQILENFSNDFSLLSSNISISENSAVHINGLSNVSYQVNKIEDQDYGFWNNIKKNFNDIKNRLKFNIVQTDTKINFEDFDIIQIYDKKFYTGNYHNSETGSNINVENLNKFVTQEIFWLSYRSNFEPIIFNKNAYTSDAGWGCMIRAGQMILAKGLYEIIKKMKQKLDSTFYTDSQNLFFDILLLFGEHTLNYKKIYNHDFFSYFKNNLKNNTKNLNKKQNNDKIFNPKKSLTLEEYECVGQEQSDFNNYENEEKTIEEENQRNFEVTPPFSIRNILNSGIKINKGAGEWFSDVEIIKILQELNTKYSPIKNLKILHFTEGTLNIDSILDQCFEIKTCKCKFIRISYGYDKAKEFEYKIKPPKGADNYIFSKNSSYNNNLVSDFEKDYVVIESDESNKKLNSSQVKDPECNCFQNCIYHNDNYYEMTHSFLLFISLRLGLEKLEECYYDSIIDFFDFKNNIGMIGGKGSRALYFIGHTEGQLIFLDPHYVQESVNLMNPIGSNNIDLQNEKDIVFNLSNSEIYNCYKSYIPQDFMTVDLDKMTPSLTLGFYFSNVKASDFTSFIEQSIQMSIKENFLFKVSNHRKKK
jgi:hypothetical protein